MKIIRRRERCPETRNLVERRLEIARPGMMRRRYDQNAQRATWVPSRSNKRNREEIAEIDGKHIQRANRLGVAINQFKQLKTNRTQFNQRNSRKNK